MNKTTFFVYKDHKVVATFDVNNDATEEEEILNYFQAAHLLHGDDVVFKIKK